MDVQFEYEGRAVWGKELGIWDQEHPDRKIYLFYDPALARKEEEDFAKHNRSIMGTKKYQEKYAEASLRFGTIGMVSNKLEDKAGTNNKGHKQKVSKPSLAEVVYFSYKKEALMRI